MIYHRPPAVLWLTYLHWRINSIQFVRTISSRFQNWDFQGYKIRENTKPPKLKQETIWQINISQLKDLYPLHYQMRLSAWMIQRYKGRSSFCIMEKNVKIQPRSLSLRPLWRQILRRCGVWEKWWYFQKLAWRTTVLDILCRRCNTT